MELKVGDAFWMYMHARFGDAIELYTRVLWEDSGTCAYAYGISADNFYQGNFSTEDLPDRLIHADQFLPQLNTWGWPGRRFT